MFFSLNEMWKGKREKARVKCEKGRVKCEMWKVKSQKWSETWDGKSEKWKGKSKEGIMNYELRIVDCDENVSREGFGSSFQDFKMLPDYPIPREKSLGYFITSFQDWWLLTENWWLATVDCWLATGDWWLKTDDWFTTHQTEALLERMGKFFG